MVYRIVLISLVLACAGAVAQTGGAKEPVRYVGGNVVDLDPHDGGLRPVVGVSNYQVMRANRTHPEMAEDYGWTYNHAPDLSYWNGRFYLEYLSNPIDEHIAPGHTLLTTSVDGRVWTKPVVTFPAYEPPAGTKIPEGYTGYMMHQRMGFYTAPDGRLLLLAFYGHTEDPFEKGGIGRVVREAYRDGTFGPIYFIRYSSHADWNGTNTSYPFYKTSTDAGFVAACDALLGDKLRTLQWWDEDKGLDGFYKVKKAGSALSFYHRQDGKVVALWKWSLAGLSEDEGVTFSKPVKCRTFVMDGGKQWGQRTDDGRYAIVYNPTRYSEHRYPLAVVTGEDGIIFDNMLAVHGEVPPRRFCGRWKDYGPQYVRGIAEGNGNPPGDAMWVAYSVNKEDMWVSRIPVPVQSVVKGKVADTFDKVEAEGFVPDWDVYSPIWAPVRVANQCLELRDQDPYDYARAVRVFEETNDAKVSFRVRAGQARDALLNVEVTDRFGNRPVQLRFDGDGHIWAMGDSFKGDLGTYEAGKWYEVEVSVDARPFGRYSVTINGKEVIGNAELAEAVESVERLSIRTGEHRTEPLRETDNELAHEPLPGADLPVKEAVWEVDDVMVK